MVTQHVHVGLVVRSQHIVWPFEQPQTPLWCEQQPRFSAPKVTSVAAPVELELKLETTVMNMMAANVVAKRFMKYPIINHDIRAPDRRICAFRRRRHIRPSAIRITTPSKWRHNHHASVGNGCSINNGMIIAGIMHV